ncbi:MAG: phytoene desaturase family protein [Candidatus Thorarchaeota archaeon]
MNQPNSPNIIVIGGGFGGLATAVRMQNAGFQVTLLEKRSQLGGRAGVIEKKGFRFDTGPTIITPPFVVEDIFREAGRNPSEYVTLVPIHPHYRLHYADGTHFDIGTFDEVTEQIRKLSPADLKGYQKWLDLLEPIYKLGFEKFAMTPFESLWSMIKIIPPAIRLKSYKSVYGLVASYMKNEKLRMAFSFVPLFIGGNPFTTTSVYSLIAYLENKYGMLWVKGGTHRLVEALERLFRELGGVLKLNSEVTKIEIDEKENKVAGVITKNDEHVPADIVVSNADVALTYMKLIDKRFRRKNNDQRFKKAKYSMSLFMVYFGTKKKYPEMPHHNVIFGPRYKELIKDIFERHILPDDFSIYLHVPTRTDPELAPPGCETFYACVPVTNQNSGINWDEKKESFKNQVLKYLNDHYLPDLLENLEVCEVFTPQDFEHELNAYKGNAFQLQPLMRQSGWFRPHNRSRDIKGLYIAGAGTHPGAGVPSVLLSGKITSDQILIDYGKPHNH